MCAATLDASGCGRQQGEVDNGVAEGDVEREMVILISVTMGAITLTMAMLLIQPLAFLRADVAVDCCCL